MSRNYRHGRPTIGVLAGWQFAWTPTPLSYLDPIFDGACLAAHDLGCNLLVGCGMGPWTGRGESLRPAWPLSSPESDFVPIGPWNTDGLIAVNPLHSQVRSRYLQDLRAAGHPLIFVASGERGPTIAADNRSGILQAMQHPPRRAAGLSSFVGREAELSEAQARLGETRLLTLLGSGGMGKTRLMLRVAEEVVERFADGVWLVELAPVTDPTTIDERVAAVFNVQVHSDRPIADALVDYLRQKDLLLLVDNAEHGTLRTMPAHTGATVGTTSTTEIDFSTNAFR